MICISHLKPSVSVHMITMALVVSAYSVSAAPHTHGEGTLHILQVDKEWQFVLQLPSADILGYEHEPRSQKERQEFKSAEETLSTFHNLFALNGRCEVKDTTLELPWPDVHEEHEDSVEEEEHNHATHSDFRVAYLLSCTTPISSIDLIGFSLWPSLHNVDVTWVTNKGQSALSLSHRDPRFEVQQ